MHFRCDKIFNKHSTANLLLSTGEELMIGQNLTRLQ